MDSIKGSSLARLGRGAAAGRCFAGCGPLRVLAWSSFMDTSSTQCSPFLKPQWARATLPKRLADSETLSKYEAASVVVSAPASRVRVTRQMAARPGQACRSCSQPMSLQTMLVRVSMRP